MSGHEDQMTLSWECDATVKKPQKAGIDEALNWVDRMIFHNIKQWPVQAKESSGNLKLNPVGLLSSAKELAHLYYER